jgi:hypothetical protein
MGQELDFNYLFAQGKWFKWSIKIAVCLWKSQEYISEFQNKFGRIKGPFKFFSGAYL